MIEKWLARITKEHDVFLFLLGYRWLSLLPPLLALLLTPSSNAAPSLVFAVALTDNFFLTVFHPRVNRVVLRIPAVFGIDLVMVAIFIALTGGDASPYYLYALSPLLAAAFFLQMRGALITASTLTLFYLAALTRAPINVLPVLTHIVSFFLIAIPFGYSAILVERIRRDRALLTQNNATLERTANSSPFTIWL